MLSIQRMDRSKPKPPIQTPKDNSIPVQKEPEKPRIKDKELPPTDSKSDSYEPPPVEQDKKPLKLRL